MIQSGPIEMFCVGGMVGKVATCTVVQSDAAYITVVHNLTTGLPNFMVFHRSGKPVRKSFKWELRNLNVITRGETFREVK